MDETAAIKLIRWSAAEAFPDSVHQPSRNAALDKLTAELAAIVATGAQVLCTLPLETPGDALIVAYFRNAHDAALAVEQE